MNELHQKLIQAIKQNDIEAVEAALSQGAPIMDGDSDALLQSVYQGNAECTQAMMPYCDRNFNESQALRVAISMGNSECAAVLLSDGLPDSENDDWIFDAAVRAVRNGKTDGVRFILNMVSKDPEIFNHIMVEAAEQGNIEVLELLIGHGFDPNFSGGKPIRTAAKRGQKQAVEFLMPYASKIDKTQAFKKASERGMLECVKLLLPYANIDDNHCNAIQMASWCGQVETVRFLSEHYSLEQLEDALLDLQSKESMQGKTGRSALLSDIVGHKRTD